MRDYREQLYGTYAKEREKLDSSSLQIGARYDHVVLTLGGGALVMSLTFLEKIAPHPATWTLWLIIPAWLLLLASVVLQVLALATSQDAIRIQLQRLDAEYSFYLRADDPVEAVAKRAPEGENEFVKRATRRNICSRWSLILGMLLLFAFSACNMNYGRRSDMSDKPTPPVAPQPTATITNRGSYTPPKNIIPPPPPKDSGGQKG